MSLYGARICTCSTGIVNLIPTRRLDTCWWTLCRLSPINATATQRESLANASGFTFALPWAFGMWNSWRPRGALLSHMKVFDHGVKSLVASTPKIRTRRPSNQGRNGGSYCDSGVTVRTDTIPVSQSDDLVLIAPCSSSRGSRFFKLCFFSCGVKAVIF